MKFGALRTSTMTKSQWRQKVKSLLERHMDPEKEEKLKETRKDVEDKKNRIIDLIKEDDEGDKKQFLLELIDDFHKQYESLYSVFGNLTGELKNKVHGKQGEGSSSSHSDSDSDSMDDNGNLETDLHEMATGLQKELEAANVEVSDLVKKLEAVNHEKESLRLELAAAFSKLHAAETVVQESKVEAESLKREKSELLIEKEGLIQKLDHTGKLEAELTHRIDEIIRERNNLLIEQENTMKRVEEDKKSQEEIRLVAHELKNERDSLEIELVAAKQEISGLKQQLDRHKQEAVFLNESKQGIVEENRSLALKVSEREEEIKHVQRLVDELKQEAVYLNESKQGIEEENRSLALKVSEMEEEIKHVQRLVDELTAESTVLKEKLAQSERENFTLQEMHERHTAEASAQIKALEDERNNFKIELDSLQSQKREIEERFESKRAEACQLNEEATNLLSQIVQLEMKVKEKQNQLTASANKLEDNEKDSLSKIESLTVQLVSSIQEVEALHAQKSQLEEQILRQSGEKEGLVFELEGSKQEASNLKQQLEQEVAHLNESSKVAEEEKNLLAVKVAAMADEIKQGLGIIEHLKTECSHLKEKMAEDKREQSSAQEAYEARISEATARVKLLEEQAIGLKLELENEKESHGLKLLAATQEISGVKEHLDLAKQEVVELIESKTTAEEEKGSLITKVSVMEEEIKCGQTLIDELVAESTSLKEKLAREEREHFSTREMHETHSAHVSAQIKALEDRISNFKLELDSLQDQKKETEEQLESKAAEANQLSEEATNLRAEITLLEMAIKEKEDQLTASLQRHEESENESASRIQSLTAEVAWLVQEVDALHVKESKLEEQILQQSGEKEGLVFALEATEKEASNLKQQQEQEVAHLNVSLKVAEEEKNLLAVKVTSMADEINQGLGIIEHLKTECSHLKEKMVEEEREQSSVQEAYEARISEATARVKLLEEQANGLKLELENEKESHKLKLLAATQEISGLKEHLDLAKQEVVDLIESKTTTEEEKGSLISKVFGMEEEIKRRQTLVDELVAESTSLNEKLAQQEREHFSTREMHETHSAQVSAQIKALEDKINNFKVELDSLQGQKRETEELLESKTAEANQLSEEATNLRAEIMLLEMAVEEKQDQLTASLKKHEDSKNESTSRIQSLTDQVAMLVQEVEALHGQESKLEEQILRQSGEKEGLVFEMECSKQEASHLKQQLEQEVAHFNESLKVAEEEKNLLAVKVAAMDEEIKQGLGIIEHLKIDCSHLKEKMAEDKREQSSAQEAYEARISEATARVKLLEEQAIGLKLELENEKESHGLKLMAATQEISGLKEHLDLAKQEVIELIEAKTTTEEEKGSLITKVSVMEEEIKRGQTLIDELVAESTSLKEKLAQQEREHFSMRDMHETYSSKASAQIKVLEDKINKFKLELDSLQGQKRETEERLESKVAEANQLSEEATNLRADILLLEMTIKEKEDQLISSLKKHDDRENESVSRIQSLTAQVASLVQEVEALRAETCELKEQISQLSGEKKGLEFELESVRQKASGLMQEIDLRKEEVANLIGMANKMKQLLDVVQKLTAESSQLKEKLAEGEQERLSFQEMHEAYVSGAAAQAKVFDEQANGLKLELESLDFQRREAEELLENKAREAKQLVEEVANLHTHVSELEGTVKQKEDQISVLLTKLEYNEIASESRLEALTTKVSNLTEELDALRLQKSELEENIRRGSSEASAQIDDLLHRINELQEESKAIGEKNVEIQLELERKSLEIVEYLAQIECLNGKIISSGVDQERIIQERENLAMKVNDLGLEVESVNNQKSGLEEQIKKSMDEAVQSKLEITGLQSRIQELEKLVMEKEGESSAFQRKLEEGEKEASSNIMTLSTEISKLREELEAMQIVRSQLETEMERGKQEYSNNQSKNIQLENENAEIRSRVSEQEAAFIKLNQEYKQLEVQLQETEVNLQATEMTTKAMAEELSMGMEKQNQIVVELEKTVEDLKFELEMAVKKSSADEVQLALSNQKLRVTEQLLDEKEQSHRAAKAKFQEEHKMLEEKVTSMSRDIADINEAYHGMIKDISRKVNDSVAELGSIIEKFEEKYEVFANSIVKVSEEIQMTKKWVTVRASDNEQLTEEVNHLAQQLHSSREEGQLLKEKMEKLLTVANRGLGEENKALLTELSQQKKAVEDLEAAARDKDELLSRLVEEKREAIRQLCMWIDYHMVRYNELKGVLLKTNASRR